jgi:glycosyltransferase involved in cell wall biosynthesis
MARRLAPLGFVSDVSDGAALFENIEQLDSLPADRVGRPLFNPKYARNYDAIFFVGPWQNPQMLFSLLRHSGDNQILYLPRGGLADNEFAGRRNLKKQIYFPLIEAHILRASTTIVFSSELEMTHSRRLARFFSKHLIIPDLFDLPETLPAVIRKKPRVSFLAEFDPRKGAAELMGGLKTWAESSNTAIDVTVGGGVRPGRENYCAEVRAAAYALVEPPVRFLGRVAPQDRAAFYAATDIFFVPSRFESYCLTVLEAISSGCVVICGANIGVLEYLPQHPAIVRLPDLSPGAIAQGMEEALAWWAANVDSRNLIRDMATREIASINCRAEHLWQNLLCN